MKLTKKEKIELETLQLIDSNSKPEGAIILIEETVNNITYIHYQEDKMYYVKPGDVEIINNKKMVNNELFLKLMGSRYKTIFHLPFDFRD